MELSLETRRYHVRGRFGRGPVRPVRLTARKLDYLHALFIHHTLPSYMLHALVAPQAKPRETSDVMHLLKNPPNDYVVQPRGLTRSRHANCAYLAYELSEKGAEALVDSGRVTYADYLLWQRIQKNYRPQHFEHDLATGYTTASLALGCRELGLRFISWLEFLNRARCPAKTRDSENPLAMPYRLDGKTRALTPDAICGIEYPAPTRAYFLCLEIDMGTEQHREHAAKDTTTMQKAKAYRHILHAELYKPLFGIQSLQVATVTNSVRMETMKANLARLAEHDLRGSTKDHLFKALPALSVLTSERPLSLGHMLIAPWIRAEREEFDFTSL